MLIRLFAPIYVNSSSAVEISLGSSRRRLKHGKPDEIINSFTGGINFHDSFFKRVVSEVTLQQGIIAG